VSAPAVLLSRRPSGRNAEEGLSLAALLDLLSEPPEPDPTRSRRSSTHRPGMAGGTGFRQWAQSCVRSAAEWGAGPGGAWRAW
jgi:hypothetical protein